MCCHFLIQLNIRVFIFPFVCVFSHSSLPTSFIVIIFLLSHLRSLFHSTLLVLHSCFVIHIAFFYCFTCHSLLVKRHCPNWRQVFLSLYCVWNGISSNSPLSLFFCHYFCTIFFGHHLSVHIFQKLLCCIVAHFRYSSHTLTGFTICIAWENMRFSSFLSSLY